MAQMFMTEEVSKMASEPINTTFKDAVVPKGSNKEAENTKVNLGGSPSPKSGPIKPAFQDTVS